MLDSSDEEIVKTLALPSGIYEVSWFSDMTSVFMRGRATFKTSPSALTNKIKQNVMSYREKLTNDAAALSNSVGCRLLNKTV